VNFLKKYYAILTGLIVFIVYLFTLAPSVVEIDSGELSTVQILWGIAHPTGYPLFTFVGHLFTLIPLPFRPIYKTNLLAAIWCSLGIMMFVYTAKLVLDNLVSFKKKAKISKAEIKKRRKEKNKQPAELKKDDTKELPEIFTYIASIAGGLILAFSKTYWIQSTAVEVYSMQMFLMNTVIYFIIKAYIYNGDNKKKELMNWLIMAFVLALCFSNHMTTLFILPGLAYLYLQKNGFKIQSFKKILFMLLLFFPVLILLYYTLVFRALQNPILNWGNPVDFERLFRHASGFQYQTWMFTSTDAAKKQLTYFLNNFPSEFNITLIVIAFGIFGLFVTTKRFFAFVIIDFLFTVLYAINYDIVDIDSYFLLAYIAVAFFAVFGVLKLFEILRDHHLHYTLPITLLLVFIIVQAFINFDEVNVSDVYTFEDYTKAILQSTDKNSLILSYQWDYFVASSYYFRYVEKFRSDVTVIDKELLRRSWYYNQLKRNSPDVVEGIQPYVEQFLTALKPFERKETFDPNLLESLYRKIFTGLVYTNYDKRTIYIAPELVENEMQKGEFALPEYQIVPDIFLFKVVNSKDYVPAQDPNYEIRLPKTRTRYIDYIEYICGSMLVRRAIYETQFNRFDRAKIYIKKLKENFPNYSIPKGLAEAIEK
jgi:hypothetical protein